MAPRMLATSDVPLPAMDPTAATVATTTASSRAAAAGAPTTTITLADRLAGVAADASASSSSGVGELPLVASSSLDLDIPVMKASSSALLEAALLVLAVPAMIFAGALDWTAAVLGCGLRSGMR